eukprot:2523876-Pyramimonas_sp.AAC.1
MGRGAFSVLRYAQILVEVYQDPVTIGGPGSRILYRNGVLVYLYQVYGSAHTTIAGLPAPH